MQPGLSPGANKTDVDLMHDQCEVSLKCKAIFQAPVIVKLLPARMQGIFKTTFIVKDLKINYHTITDKRVTKNGENSLSATSVQEVREVLLAVLFKAEVVNCEGDVPPPPRGRAALWGLQCKALNG